MRTVQLLVKMTLTVLLPIAVASVARAQSVITPPPPAKTVSLAGPRFGMTALSPGIQQELAKRDVVVNSNISQFGWQFERVFYTKDSGVAALNEWVVLLGGLEQGVAIPSLSWLVGLRSRDGAEFGIGPNITAAGVGLVIAGGITMRTGSLNVPLNVAVVPSRLGSRVSVLSGFNFRRR